MSGQQHDPAALYPRERPGTHFTGDLVGPRAGLDRCGKSLPPTGIQSPDRPARSSVAIPTELPGPRRKNLLPHNATVKTGCNKHCQVLINNENRGFCKHCVFCLRNANLVIKLPSSRQESVGSGSEFERRRLECWESAFLKLRPTGRVRFIIFVRFQHGCKDFFFVQGTKFSFVHGLL